MTRLILAAFLTLIAFAANSVLNRMAVAGGHISVGDFAIWRVAAGAVTLLGLSVILRGRKFMAIARANPKMRLAGGFCLATYMLGFSLAYLKLDAGLGTLLLFGPYELNPGEGAFYGPKLEFVLTDAIGRDWQCGTLQVDFVLPERLDANYIGEDGAKHRPVMLHRATLGSFERFIGILIEEHAGKLPFWLAPRQVVVASIVSEADDYVREVVAALKARGVRAEADVRNEKINYKVREHSVGKVPVILAIGRKEVEDRTVTLRRLGEKQTAVVALDEVVGSLAADAVPPDMH